MNYLTTKTALVVALTIALAGCETVGLIRARFEALTGQPIHLTNATAAARYLDIACASNEKIKAISAAQEKALEEADTSSKDNLIAAATKIDELFEKLGQVVEGDVKAMTDPSFIWPDTVRGLVREMAAADLEKVSSIKGYLELGGTTEMTRAAIEENRPVATDQPWKNADIRSSEKASAIRSALRLPSRGGGCESGKRTLILEEIERLQK